MRGTSNRLAHSSTTRGREPFGARCFARRPFRRTTVPVRAGIFDFLGGGASAGSSKANELVEELLTVSRRAGSNPSQSSKDEVADLANQLKRFRPRAPTKSPLFWGDYEVAFASNPKATGGPVLRSGPGQLIFGGQKPQQSLQQPSTLVNIVQYKTLGLVPGTVTQNGELSILDNNRYEVNLDPVGLNRGESIKRRFEILYLDDRVRVVQFQPEEKERDPNYFVFERMAEAVDMAEDEEDEDENQLPEVPKKSGTWQIGRAASSGGDQVGELTESLREQQEKSRSVAQQLKEAEKSASSTMRSARPARAQIDKAQKEATEVELQLAAAVEAAKAADARYQQASINVRELEKAAR